MTGGRAAVFLDRDGVLNAMLQREGRVGSPRRQEEFELLPGAAEAVRALRRSGLLVFVVTNQPDVARGHLSLADLDGITAALRAAVEVDEVAVCPHDDVDACSCRKPKPGMFLDLAARWGVDLAASFAVGDTWKDVEAGKRAGCRTVLVEGPGTTQAGGNPNPDWKAASLEEAAELIASHVGLSGGGTTMDFVRRFLAESAEIAGRIDAAAVERMAAALIEIRARGGRLFFVGVGGGAGHASHAVNDFRKLASIECYAPTDNVSELTARINDEGWDGAYAAWLEGSRLGPKDGVFVFSVGGGSEERAISVNVVNAVNLAKRVGATVLGVVGRDGGHTARVGDAVLVVPTVDADLVTPHTEAFQAVIWHLLVSHPRVATHQGKWESTMGLKT